ncbi:transglutaminaseTgpA domain-containing protein [Pseudomonas alcaligenes]|uniref:transglutaminase family protein n=1 Tax=Aquipseudomonas alcaligenes TaxID=43263 RepID=UPI00358E8DAD
MSRGQPSAIQPIPRIALTWLLVAQVLVILPHLLHLPPWIIGLWLLCAGWRIQVYRMRARFPNGLERAGLMLATAAAVFLSRGSLIGLDGGVLLLVAAFIIKLVELRSRRDALLLIFLGFFVVVTAYLFDDSLLAALYSLLPVTALLAALIGLQHSGLAERPAATFKLAASMLLQAVPLMLLLFLFFPRLGPLWSLPNPQQSSTGLSDSMAPADVAELSRSPALAFRASFNGEIPPREQLYWRALTLEHFDGRRWSQSAGSRRGGAVQWSPQGEALEYSIVMQPSGRPWLFVLDVGLSELPGASQMDDFRVELRRPVLQNLLYEARSWPTALRQPVLPADMARRTLQLPPVGDPRSREWAAQLRRQHERPQALVAALLQHFNREPYGYTLKPPPVGEHSIDEFLFRTRQGFCAHYAGAMVFVLRAAGIPARVVAGYQGGELNAAGNYLSVRQLDAHAWVEYWQEGRGWVSVDPTFQVAPERIELGSQDALASDEGFLEGSPLSPLRYRDIAWLNQLRLAWDNINHNWQRWVLGYRGEQQLSLLQRWFGTLEWHTLVPALVGGGALLLGLLALWLFKPWRRERDPQRRVLRRFETLLRRHGLHRAPGEGVRAFAARAAQALPQQGELIAAFAAAFEAQRYAGAAAAPEDMRRLLRRLRRELPWRARPATEDQR